jgi:hypothetical protein
MKSARRTGHPRVQANDASPPGLLTAPEVVAKYGVTYKGLWLVEARGLVQPLNKSKERYRERNAGTMTFREFMASHGFERPNEDWSPEDVAAWDEDDKLSDYAS